MLLAIKCMSVAFLTGYALGVPLVWLVRRGKALTETDWLYAPFVGLGVMTLVTHELVYHDVRVLYSAPAIWIAAALLWCGLGVRCGWRTPFRNCPWRVLAATLAVYAIHGFGLLLLGPDLYVGRMHFDRVNYISLSQFMVDVPFSTDWTQLDHRAYLVDGLLFKNDRTGVMTLLASLSVISAEWANRLFEPLILLGPALVVPAVVLLGRALGFRSREARLAALAGGLIPGLSTLHTCGFLANVIAVPFLLASVAATAAVVTGPSVRRVLLAALLFAATASLYTELALLLVAVAGTGAVFAAVVGRAGWLRPLGTAIGVLALALAIFPRGESAQQLPTMLRGTTNTHNNNPLPWMTPERLPGATWVCDFWPLLLPPDQSFPFLAMGSTLSFIAVVGIGRSAVGALARTDKARSTESAVVALLLGCLAVGPVVLLLSGRYDYQGTKLFLSLAPIQALGVVAVLRPRELAGPCSGRSGPWGTVASAFCRATPVRSPRMSGWRVRAAGGLVAVFGCETFLIAAALTWDSGVPCSDHRLALDPNLNMVKFSLRATDGDAVLALGRGMAYNSEVCFAARRHRVWLVCPEINNHFALGCHEHPFLKPIPQGREFVDLDSVPREATVYALAGPSALIRIEGAKYLLREHGPYQVWHVGPGPYKLIATEHALRPAELDHPSPTIRNPFTD